MASKYARRHYEDFAQLIADVISAETPTAEDVVRETLQKMVWLFEEDNPNFDAGRFRDRILQRLSSTLEAKMAGVCG